MTEPNDNLPPTPAPDPAPAAGAGVPPPASDPQAQPQAPLGYQTPGTSSGPTPYTGPAPTPDDKTMAMLAHLLGIVTGFVGPLIIWLVKKDQSPFVDDQGKEALNFQLTLLIGWLVASVTAAFCIGFFLMPVVL